MGSLFSRKQKVEENDNFDTITIWGSDIDDELCGPGKICADEWTPLSSLSSTPEPSNYPEEVITEQPRGYTTERLVITPEPSRYEEEYIPNDEYYHDEYIEDHTPPVIVRKHRKMKKKRLKKPRRKIRRVNNKVHVIIDIDQNKRIERVVDLDDQSRKPIRVRHRRNQEPEHLHVPSQPVPIRQRHHQNHHHQKPMKQSTPIIVVHRTFQKPVYRHRHLPKIPAPSPYDPESAPKFIQRNRHEIIYTRAVPPSRYKGLKMEPPDPFRVRRVSNNYH